MPCKAEGQKLLRSGSGSLCRPCGSVAGLPVFRPRWSLQGLVESTSRERAGRHRRDWPFIVLAPGLQTLFLMACG